MEPKRQHPDSPQRPEHRLRWAVLFGAIFLGYLAWGFFYFRGLREPRVVLPYSAFLAQVREDNVARVRITGDQISGAFVRPVTWPAPQPAASAAGRAQAVPDNPASNLGRPWGIYSDLPAPVPPAPAAYREFVTTFPESVGDAALLPLLDGHGVLVDATPTANPLFGVLFATAVPILLFVGVFVWMGRRSGAGPSAGALSFARARTRRDPVQAPPVTFGDVAGANEAKADLQEVVDILRNPHKYQEIGARIPRGVLLVGPPGTGKTLLARAVAGEAGVPFFNISASEFVEMYVGVGASRVRDLFAKAREAAPAVVFIDEMDAVGRRRGAGPGHVNDEREQTLNQLLVELDGFDERREVILFAATNRPDVLDPALLRPGRFDRQVTVNLPDRKGREEILRVHTRSLPLAADVDLNRLAGGATGFSGADLANLCNEAALVAARHDRRQVTLADFEEAMDKIVLGGERPLLLDSHERRVVAYHEAGHALVAWLTPAADPVHKVTIVARGRALGVTEQRPEKDQYNYGQEYLLARLAVMLGGRVAEEIAIGEITTGAENDLIQGTRLARRMVTRWAMGNLGPVAFETDDDTSFLGYSLGSGREYSESTAMRIDAEVVRLLEERYATAQRLLTDARGQLDRLVEVLLQEETVSGEEMAKILGPRPVQMTAVRRRAA